jgi:hypothetical protein
MANQQNLFNQELKKKNTETRKVIEKINNDYHYINKNIEQIQSYSESFKNTDFPILDNPTISLTSENDLENEETTAEVQIYKNEAQQKLTANIPRKNGYFRDETPSQVTNRINQGLNSTDYFVAESQVHKAVELKPFIKLGLEQQHAQYLQMKLLVTNRKKVLPNQEELAPMPQPFQFSE